MEPDPWSNASLPPSRVPSSDSSTDSHDAARRLSMLGAILIALGLLALAFASGCGSRTVLVPEGAPVRIGPGAKARVYVMSDGEWMLGRNWVEIPEGWYLVPPSFAEDSEAP